MTITAVTMAALSTVQQQIAANQAEDVYDDTVKNADRAALEEFSMLDKRRRQEEAKAAQTIASTTSAARKARASAALSAIESGTQGGSVDALLSQFEQNELEGAQTHVTNLQFTREQLEAEKRATAARRNDRVFSALPGGGPFDSLFGTIFAGAQIVGTGITTRADVKAQKAAAADNATPS